MTWPVKNLNAHQITHLHVLVEALGEELKADISLWPKDACSDTVCLLLPVLRKEFGNHGYRFSWINGYYNDENHWEVPHTWIQISDGTIIDPTAGQFLGEHPLGIFSKDDPRYLRKRL